MKLFVISCDYHRQISQLSAYLALKNIPGITELIFLWDDFLTNSPPRLHNKQVINFSTFQSTANIADGWIRQQIVKLQLHHLTDDEKFYVLDGDTLIRNTIDLRPNKILSSPGIGYPPYFDFIRHVLKLEKNNDFSFISPLLLLEKEVLQKLEEYCVALNGCCIANSWLKYVTEETSKHLSEGEIYGTFATQVLQKHYTPIVSSFSCVFSQNETGPRIEDLFFTTNNDIVLFGTDTLIDHKFWRNINMIYRDFAAFRIGIPSYN